MCAREFKNRRPTRCLAQTIPVGRGGAKHRPKLFVAARSAGREAAHPTASEDERPEPPLIPHSRDQRRELRPSASYRIVPSALSWITDSAACRETRGSA